MIEINIYNQLFIIIKYINVKKYHYNKYHHYVVYLIVHVVNNKCKFNQYIK